MPDPTPSHSVQLHTTARADDDRVVVEVSGEIDPATSDRLTKAIDSASATGAGPVALDFAGVTFIDSAGVAVLAKALIRLSAENRELTVVNASGTVARVLTISGLAERLQLA